jgi:hypothetical protein
MSSAPNIKPTSSTLVNTTDQPLMLVVAQLWNEVLRAVQMGLCKRRKCPNPTSRNTRRHVQVASRSARQAARIIDPFATAEVGATATFSALLNHYGAVRWEGNLAHLRPARWRSASLRTTHSDRGSMHSTVLILVALPMAEHGLAYMSAFPPTSSTSRISRVLKSYLEQVLELCCSGTNRSSQRCLSVHSSSLCSSCWCRHLW